MKKYNCNNTLDYSHETKRMCETFRGCSGCPLHDLDCRESGNITPEHIRRVQAWSDAHPEVILTDEQREIFKALDLLGLKFIAKDSNGAVYAFAERPEKWFRAWGVDGEYFDLESKYLRAGVSDAISPLVSWNDKEPLNIAEALKQQEEVNHNEEIQL